MINGDSGVQMSNEDTGLPAQPPPELLFACLSLQTCLKLGDPLTESFHSDGEILLMRVNKIWGGVGGVLQN